MRSFLIRLLLYLNIIQPRPDPDPVVIIEVPAPIEPPPKVRPNYSITQDSVFRAMEHQMNSRITRYIYEIMENREEILRAFIAKYGCDPDEIEQILSIDTLTDDFTTRIRWKAYRKVKKEKSIDIVPPSETNM